MTHDRIRRHLILRAVCNRPECVTQPIESAATQTGPNPNLTEVLGDWVCGVIPPLTTREDKHPGVAPWVYDIVSFFYLLDRSYCFGPEWDDSVNFRLGPRIIQQRALQGPQRDRGAIGIAKAAVQAQ